ncbi:TetR family transcriptional regulator [Nocardia colli]|uniref:TetR family transcriptional regulator n=1 Tax=Nocardia colli TaxID=2545717 RepID=UPI00168D935D|nr:TetR family transcriptional regulator [Nocardia colli]
MREYILETAVYLLGKDPHTGIDEVAAVAGIGTAQFYQYFESMDELRAAVAAEARSKSIHH